MNWHVFMKIIEITLYIGLQKQYIAMFYRIIGRMQNNNLYIYIENYQVWLKTSPNIAWVFERICFHYVLQRNMIKCLFEMSVENRNNLHVSYLKDVFHTFEKNLIYIFMCLDNDIHPTIFIHCSTTIRLNDIQLTEFSKKILTKIRIVCDFQNVKLKVFW